MLVKPNLLATFCRAHPWDLQEEEVLARVVIQLGSQVGHSLDLNEGVLSLISVAALERVE